jgi:hypothetical protein
MPVVDCPAATCVYLFKIVFKIKLVDKSFDFQGILGKNVIQKVLAHEILTILP